MPRGTLSLDEQMEELYLQSFDSFGDEENDNSASREKMKQMLGKAMKKQLTDRQRQCLSMYYFENKKMEQISLELGLHKSTISRHITAARVKLQKLTAFVD